MHGLISGLFILFHWSIFLFLCQYHTVLMSVGLQYNLKSGRLIPPFLLLILQATLVIWDRLFPIRIVDFFSSSYVRNTIGNLMRMTLNLLIA